MNKNQKKHTILVVDDTAGTLEVLKRNLDSQGYSVLTAGSADEAIIMLETAKIDLVITDYKMPKVNGIDLIRHIRENYVDTEAMMITGYATVECAVEAVKCGAEEYLSKPFTDEELFTAVKRVLEKLARRRAISRSRVHGEGGGDAFGLIGESIAMKKVFSAIKRASLSSATVLITGESGSGKELVARAIHYHSSRAAAPFIPINCGSIPETLLESELFGYVKGAFTDARESRAGFFQTADGGTLFLDEISETSLAMQVKLLRVLQEKEVSMVGDCRPRKVDVRIIAATNKDLPGMIQNRHFREELYYRINVITIEIPPLRDRGEDIFLLIRHFASKFASELGRPAPHFSEKAMARLKRYAWPGNVRELENFIQRIIVMHEEDTIDVPHLPLPARFSAMRAVTVNRTLAEIESGHIRNVLVYSAGNKTKAAEILGIDRKTLREKVKRYNLE